MAGDQDWGAVRSKVKGQCPNCPRDRTKMPVHLARRNDPSKVEFLIISQEPGFWLRQLGSGEAVEQKLIALCKNGGPADEVKKTNPLIKLLQIFGSYDPTEGRVYWTHALKCVPANGDRDVNKEWRKAATKCQEHFM